MYGAPSRASPYVVESWVPPTAGKSPFLRPKRHMGFAVIFVCLLVPIALFAAVCAVLSFSMHHSKSGLAWFVVVLGAVAVAAASTMAAVVVLQRYWNEDTTREPLWYVFLAFTMLLAWVAAILLGLDNYQSNMVPYLDLQSLSANAGVDPAATSGQQLMDAGRVTFAPGTKLDVAKSIGFQNQDRYCVVPIAPADGGTLESYDFWAIGLNCCSGRANSFHCGDYANPDARAGLRLMSAEQRGLYRLAVKQAEATYSIQAQHPLFFYWMQDPLAQIKSYRSEVLRYYLLSLGMAVVCQFLLLAIAVLGLSKL